MQRFGVLLWLSACGVAALNSRRKANALTPVSANASPKTHRVAWLHVPKCGASFGTTLAHYANSSLPGEARVLDKHVIVSGRKLSYPEGLFVDYPVNQYFKDLLWLKGGDWGNHLGIDNATFEEFKGDFFGLFRHPASRAISSWRDTHAGGSAHDFALKVEGQASKMITGQESFDKKQCCTRKSIVPNMDLAIERLSAFRFVGLQEEYALSVCLFHAMFGGDCLPAEFDNVHPGPGGYEHQTIDQDIQTLKGYVDPFDSVLYEKVREIFQMNLKKYNVKKSTCAKSVCPAMAEHFIDLENARV